MKKIILFSCFLVLIGCDKDEDRVQSTDLIINFTHTVAGEDLLMYPFGCLDGGNCIAGHACCNGGLNYTNAAGDHYNIARLLYVISDINLHFPDGSVQLLKEMHFVDADKASTVQFNTGKLNNGTYTKISFTMGLNASMNQPDAYPQLPAGMEWPASPGDPTATAYHYMQLEGAYDTLGTFYNTHTGPLMGMDMSFNKEFEISLNVDDNLGDVNVFVNMELNNWYQNPNMVSFKNYTNTMFDMDAQHKLKENGETDVFTLTTK